jgi:hypothetical protein
MTSRAPIATRKLIASPKKIAASIKVVTGSVIDAMATRAEPRRAIAAYIATKATALARPRAAAGTVAASGKSEPVATEVVVNASAAPTAVQVAAAPGSTSFVRT